MPLMPFGILGMWLRGLLAVAILAGGIALLHQWYHEAHVWEPAPVRVDTPPGVDRDDPDRAEIGRDRPARRVFHWEPGWNRETGLLAAGLALLTWAVAGRLVGRGLSSLLPGSGSGGSGPSSDDSEPARGGAVQRLRRPDGTELQVESYGPPDAPTIVLTHGWGADSTAWYYAKRDLTDRFRVVVWDLPGLGRSKAPDDNNFDLEKLAGDLDAVLGSVGERPAVLVGHSIGGMILLTFCRLFPEALGGRVTGLVLVNTTYTNPVRTTRGAALYTALEKPVLVPLLYLTIGLWPLVWLMNWMSYLNGSVHRSTHRQSFAGTETRGQLDFVARLMPRARPDVLARGMLAMLHYDATATLGTVGVPVLVVAGDGDTMTVPEASRFIAGAVPRAEFETLSPTRHMGPIERHDQLDPRLAEFAGACVRPRAVGGVAG